MSGIENECIGAGINPMPRIEDQKMQCLELEVGHCNGDAVASAELQAERLRSRRAVPIGE